MIAPLAPLVLSAPPRGSVLVLAPHPDDEVLGCGGALLLHRRQDDPVKIVFVTDGMAGDPDGHYAGGDYPAIRRAEAGRAADIIGAGEVTFWEYEDGRLAGADDLAERLVSLFAVEKPDVVYRPSPRESHPDHRALALAADRALDRFRGRLLPFSYEVWAPVQATHIIDITPVWDLKRKAVEQYESQLRYNDYIHKILGLNAYRAIHLPSGRYAEAFEAS